MKMLGNILTVNCMMTHHTDTTMESQVNTDPKGR